MPADSRITAVTVYADAAVVTRAATFDLPIQGKTEVTFENLPATLVDRSLKAAGRGTAQARGLTTSVHPSAGSRPAKTVTVRLEVTTPGAFNLALTYAVPGAKWTPVYAARILRPEHAVQFDYSALVSQKTGENWENVDLTLSTLNANGSRSPTYPGPNNPNPFGERRAGPIPNPQNGVTITSIPKSVPITTQGVAATLKISAPARVGGDGTPAKVSVAEKRLPSENEFLGYSGALSPSFTTFTATVSNSVGLPLVAGEVHVLLGDLSATRPIPTVMPGECFQLVLGDKSVVITRKLASRIEDDGPLHQSWRINYDVVLTVTNKLPTTEKVVLIDQVPTPGTFGSKQKKTTVVSLLPPTEPTARFDRIGQLEWTLMLAPGEVREVPERFSIEFLDMPVRQGHVKIGELQIVDDRGPAPAATKK